MSDAFFLGHRAQCLHIFLPQAQGDLFCPGRLDDDLKIVQRIGKFFYAVVTPKVALFVIGTKGWQFPFLARHREPPLLRRQAR
jgi:hypothetical protein